MYGLMDEPSAPGNAYRSNVPPVTEEDLKLLCSKCGIVLQVEAEEHLIWGIARHTSSRGFLAASYKYTGNICNTIATITTEAPQ